jgi:hypothetical protein
MRPKRAEEFMAVQRESTQVAGELRKALFSIGFTRSPSPVQGGLHQPPSPSGGRPALALLWVVRTTPNGRKAH